MEGRGEIAIPKKLTTKNRGKRKRNTKKPYTGDLLSISNSDHGMSTEYLNASSSDHLNSKNASKRTSYQSLSISMDSDNKSGGWLSANGFDNDDIDGYEYNDGNHYNIDQHGGNVGICCNNSNEGSGNDIKRNDSIQEEEEEQDEDRFPTADDYNEFILRNTTNNYDQESDTSSFYGSDYYNYDFAGNHRGGRIMFNLAQRDSSIDLRDTRVEDPVVGEYEL